MKQKLLSLLLSVSLCLSLLPFGAMAADLTYEVPDTNIVLTYKVNTDGTVTITGCNSDASGKLDIPAVIDGKSVTSIGSRSFFNCTGLTDVTIPDSATVIDFWSFCNCTGLTRVTISASVTHIPGAFSNCKNLTNIVLSDQNESLCKDGKVIFNKDKTKLVLVERDIPDNYQIPDSVTSLEMGAFSGCTELTTITIPDSVTSLGGGHAFYCCPNLTSITIPSSVGTIGGDTFEGCPKLTINTHCNTNAEHYAKLYGIALNTTHDELEVVPETAATCTAAGLSAGEKCKTCGAFVTAQIEVTPALGHDFSGDYISDEIGHWHKCSRCEEIDIKATHTFGDWITVKEATEAAAGRRERACNICGYKQTAIIPATGGGSASGGESTDVYQEMTFQFNNYEGACTVKLQAAYVKTEKLNLELGSYGGGELNGLVTVPVYYLKPGSIVTVDTPEEGTFTLIQMVKKDDGVYGDGLYTGLGSGYGTTDYLFKPDDVPPDIMPAGGYDLVCIDTYGGTPKYFLFALGASNDCSDGHTPVSAWSSDATGHWHICTVCNEKVDSASHNYGAWTTTKEATATAAGRRERACTICGYKQTETIPATGGGTGSGGGSIGGGSVVAPPTEEKKDDEQPTTTTSFTDIPTNTWYNEAVSFVTEKGLMSGTGTDTFAPGDNLTRAMLAQILYNNENKPSTSGGNFTDVQSGAWYADAITWASQTGIVSGYGNGQFGPNDSITREQLAVMLWRYAGQPASNTSLTGFTDIGKASDYTLTALQWAVEKGIISGKGNGTLDPTGNATRAEVAQMLMNYFK